MIVILSKDTERIRSNALLIKIQEMHDKMMDGEYGQEPCPEDLGCHSSIGVEAELNEHAVKRINAFHDPLDTYEGKTVMSKTRSEMQRVE